MIYFVRCQLTKLVKIGYTSQDRIADRIDQLRTGSPGDLEFLGAMAGYLTEERVLHGKYADKHVRGEWFALTDDDIAAEPLSYAGYVQSGVRNDAWMERRLKEAAVNSERRGAGMQAEPDRWDRSFLDEMPPKARRDFVEAMLERWRMLKKKKGGRTRIV